MGFSNLHFSFRLISLDNSLHLFTHGTSVVMRQGSLDAFCTEHVLTLQSSWIAQGIEANGTFIFPAGSSRCRTF